MSITSEPYPICWIGLQQRADGKYDLVCSIAKPVPGEPPGVLFPKDKNALHVIGVVDSPEKGVAVLKQMGLPTGAYEEILRDQATNPIIERL